MSNNISEMISSPHSGTKTRDHRIALLLGDALQTLKGLPDGIVHCGVTSPPYFHQRDYSRAVWVDGSQDCDHVQDASRTKVQGNSAFNENRPSRASTRLDGYYFKEVQGGVRQMRSEADRRSNRPGTYPGRISCRMQLISVEFGVCSRLLPS